MSEGERSPEQLAAEARFLAVAFVARLANVAEVRDWSEAVIAEQQPAPAMWARVLRLVSRRDRLSIYFQLTQVANDHGQVLLSERHLARLYDRLADVITTQEVDVSQIQLALEAVWMSFPERAPTRRAIELRQRLFERTWHYHHRRSQALAELSEWLRREARLRYAST